MHVQTLLHGRATYNEANHEKKVIVFFTSTFMLDKYSRFSTGYVPISRA